MRKTLSETIQYIVDGATYQYSECTGEWNAYSFGESDRVLMSRPEKDMDSKLPQILIEQQQAERVEQNQTAIKRSRGRSRKNSVINHE
mmetsp:Transcript_4393/g.7724  ORF Transcript_4393/g.7724 Transcript_4393/m.7724 type:complete len:88 (+) Transcript_4393:717-980(+)